MKNILLYITLFAALSLGSCNDWLDVKPKSRTDEKQMFKSVEGFKSALTACYIKLNSQNLYGKNLIMTSIEFMAQHWSYASGSFQQDQELKDFKYENSYPESLMLNIYKEMYNTIVQANSILSNMQEHRNVIQDENTRAVIEAEALAIRAFCHMDILRLFGQMPQNGDKKVSLPYAKTVSSDLIPYYSFDDFTNLILADLDAAEALFEEHDPLFDYSFEELDNFFNNGNVKLTDEFLGFRRFRFNYYAVKAIRARLYMYLGKKPEAYAAAKEIIDAEGKNGKKVLTLAGTKDINSRNFALPSECILALSNNNIEQMTGNLFKSNEDAVGNVFLTEKQFENDLFVGQSTGVNNRVQIWEKVEIPTKEATYVIKKYNQPESTSNTGLEVLATQKQVIPLIRLSEMYLIAMEAATTLDEANALYLPYMQARNVLADPLKKEELITEILREYRREFYGEGLMFYTYKRLGMKNMLWREDEVSEQDYIVPLPKTELKNVN